MQADLSGRVAIVMGGTRGIGRAIALKLASAGARVVVQGRDPAAGAEVEDAGEEVGPRPVFVAADFLDYAGIAELMRVSAERFGRIDVLVANGGSRRPGPVLLEKTAPEDIPGYFEGRLYPRINAIHAVLPYMRERGYGKIVGLTTDAGRTPTPGESLLGAAAAAHIFLTRALGRELARHGIRVNTIATSLTAETPAYDTYQRARDRGSDEPVVKAFRKIEDKAPFGLNRPDDLAELALYLAAPESDQLSGATISVNGGISFPA